MYIFKYTYIYIYECSYIDMYVTCLHTRVSRLQIHGMTFTHMELRIYIYAYVSNRNICLVYRVAKTHRIPYLYRSFSAKVTYIQWLFCGK